MNIWQVFILSERKLVELNGFLGFFSVVVGVAESDKGLELLIIVFERLLVVLDGTLCSAGFKKQVSHRDQC